MESSQNRDEIKKIVIDLDDSDDLLQEVDALEAEAVAKRPRVTAVSEGAALQGSISEQRQMIPFNPDSKSRASVNSRPAGNYGSEAGEQDFPEMKCSCGAGLCLILTSSTSEKPGRKYYKCPIKEANRNCGFFKWCDVVQSSRTQPAGTSYQSYGIGKTGTVQSGNRRSETGPGKPSSAAGDCVKCGKPGHRAKDCSIRKRSR